MIFIVCPIHVHGFGQTKFSLMSVRTYVRVYVRPCARSDRIEVSGEHSTCRVRYTN